MINFINPWILPALAAASIPLILHLLSKRKVKVVPFSSLRFLSLLENKRIKHVRLYQILLIVIRTLFILFLVLAFARPAWKSGLFNASSSARATAVLLVDNSYSMEAYRGSHTLLDLVKNSGRDILSTFSEDDALFVLTPQKDDSVAGPFTPEQAAVYLKKLHPVHGVVDFRPALDRAANLFRRYANYNREFYLLSDMRISKAVFPDSFRWSVAKPVPRIFTVNPTERLSLKNIGIDTVIIANRIFDVRKPVNLHVKLRNDAHIPQETLLNIYISGKRAAMQKVQLPALARSVVEISITPQSSGFQLLSAEIDDDDLPLDNRYYNSFYLPPQIKILLVSKHLNPLFSAAVDVLQQGSVLSFTRSDYGRWQGAMFQKYQLIVLDDPPQLNADVLARLKKYIASGRNIFILPGTSATLSQLNQITRYLIKRDLFRSLQSIPEGQGFITLRKNDLQKALFRDWSGRLPSLEMPRFYKYFSLLPTQSGLLHLQNGAPFLARFSVSAGKVYILTSRPDTRWNDWPLSGLFVPLLYRFCNIAGQTPAYTLQQITGVPLALRLPFSPGQQPYQFGAASGKVHPLFPKNVNSHLLFNLPAQQTPGHYLLRRGRQTQSVISINLPAAEFQRPYIDANHFKTGVTVYRSPEQIKKLRRGQELWYLFLTLALAMLLLELFLIKKLEGKGAA